MIPDAQPDTSRLVDRRIALAKEWDELVERIRKLDDFKEFLCPPSIETLLPTAAGGPIAIINISQWRCDALLITTSGVEVEELPGVTAHGVADRAGNYLQVLSQVDEAAHELHAAWQRYDAGDRGLDAISQYTRAKQALQQAVRDRDLTLADVLAWLWDEIADPVLTALGFISTPEPGQSWPRLWWCPTGLLTLLPLHAAGHYDDGQPSGGAVLDRVVSSYTPTLRALLEARRPLDPLRADERMLVVALPETPGEVPLTDVTRERELLTALFAGHRTLLEGAAATSQAVREELPRHRWAHFSCHGGQNLADPSQGGLLLYDRLLSIATISAGRYRGEFAFLSACMTATGGLDLPDEAITLVAALHYTGYRHVIGTLWSVYDSTAADMAETVYKELTSTGQFEPAGSALALHNAVRALRDNALLPPSAWAPFIHTGP
jgi:hypothetical protein